MLHVERYALDALTLPVVRLRDPRSGQDARFCFQWHLENALYGGPTGGLYRLLQRCSLSTAGLTMRKASVMAGHVSDAHFKQQLSLLSESLPHESQARARRTATPPSLLPPPPSPA